jgi:hypothetical protein
MIRSAGDLHPWYITNEFAQVKLTVDKSGNDPRLCIEDLSTERRVYLDAFMLASFTMATEQELARFMDPNPRIEEAN